MTCNTIANLFERRGVVLLLGTYHGVIRHQTTIASVPPSLYSFLVLSSTEQQVYPV